MKITARKPLPPFFLLVLCPRPPIFLTTPTLSPAIPLTDELSEKKVQDDIKSNGGVWKKRKVSRIFCSLSPVIMDNNNYEFRSFFPAFSH